MIFQNLKVNAMSQNTSQQTILAVDDTPTNIDVVKRVLSDSYFIQAAVNEMKKHTA
jgi:CheY-like chemotaxis protein